MVRAEDRMSSLTSAMRESAAAAATAPSISRREKLLGAIPPPARPLSPLGGGGGGDEFKEEDVWEVDTSGRQTPPPPPPPTPSVGIPSEPVGRLRRPWMDSGGGLGRGLSALSRPAAPSAMRVSSASRMIPQSVASNSSSSSSNSSMKGGIMVMQSAPVNVPDWSKLRGGGGAGGGDGFNGGGGDEFEELEDGDSEEERLPPHILVARSQATTFSVFEGAGRTLKGRDLSRVRNAVLKQTGFL